jgi:glycosyltransferase involved in cell wall biosynthesis
MSQESWPRVAVCTFTMDREAYTRRMLDSIRVTTSVPFDHYVIDNASTDGTRALLEARSSQLTQVVYNPTNVGLSVGTNQALDMLGERYDYIVKVDNDCEFKSEGWLEALIAVAEARGREVVLSPRVDGLGPGMEGGHPRYGTDRVAGFTIGLTDHIGGICCFAPTAAYRDFRYGKTALHGYQDVLFSIYVRQKLGWDMAYVEDVSVLHMDTTMAQEDVFPEYFRERLNQEREVYGEHPALTALLRVPRRIALLVKMDRGGFIEGGLPAYLFNRAKARLRS